MMFPEKAKAAVCVQVCVCAWRLGAGGGNGGGRLVKAVQLPCNSCYSSSRLGPALCLFLVFCFSLTLKKLNVLVSFTNAK